MNDSWNERVRAALGLDEAGSDGPRAVADVDPKRWHEAVRVCRDALGCDFFDWLSAVDEGDGFRVVAHLWSVPDRRGVLLRARLTEGAVDTVTDLFPGADWHERETHEMFGVDFPGHPGLTPLLLTEEFEGHPLRKDFVLASRVVKPWPGAKEPGGGRVSKRAPKRPPGVPEDWLEPETANRAEPADSAPESNAPEGSAPEARAAAKRVPRGRATERPASDGTAPEGGSAGDHATETRAPESPGPDGA